MQLSELIADHPVRVASGNPAGVRITDVVEDSRTCVPGCLFIARPGTKTDGSTHAHDAVRRGAAAVLTATGAPLDLPEHCVRLETADPARTGAAIAHTWSGAPSHALFVAGVTGTNGKTTVGHFAHAMLNSAGIRTGIIGTVCIDDGAEIGDATLTTPPATEVARSLATMVDNGCTAAILESSSHALDQGRVEAVDWNAAAFTNLSGDHLDYHGDMGSYARAKARLFAALPEDAAAIVNAHDPAAQIMLESCCARNITRVAPAGCDPDGADASLEILEASIAGSRLVLNGPWGTASGPLPAIGAHNATNALFAACIAHAAGLTADQIADALPRVTPPPGRLQRVSPVTADEPAVFIDFAHTDDALSTTLASIRAVAPERPLVALFGCGGDRDRTKRPRMGQAACRHAQQVVLTSDNPRTESPSAIIADVLEGLTPEERSRVQVHADRKKAIAEAVRTAPQDAVIVIAGKGHEREQILPDGAGGTRRTPFDDYQEAAAALRDRAGTRATHEA